LPGESQSPDNESAGGKKKKTKKKKKADAEGERPGVAVVLPFPPGSQQNGMEPSFSLSFILKVYRGLRWVFWKLL
jgi:hypothetical protein